MNGTTHGDEQRERLMQVIRGDPGIHIGRLACIAGIGWTTCEHHLRMLEQDAVITRRRVQGRWRVFASDTHSAPHLEGAGLLRDARNARIIDAIRARPGIAQGGLPERVGIPPSSLCRRVQALARSGLIERKGRGRDLLLYPTQALAEVRPAEDQVLLVGVTQ